MILITGATGNIGRELLPILRQRGATVAATTRNPAEGVFPQGVSIIKGDPSEPARLSDALEGADAIFLVPRAVGESTKELLALAAERGVRRVVVLSAITVEYGGGYRRFAEAFKAVEDAAMASSLEWTFLRCAQFYSNAMIWAPQIRQSGAVRGAYGDAVMSPIHPRDIAAVAVVALLDTGHAGKAYALTGPDSFAQREQVRLIGDAIGADVPWIELPPEQVRDAMLAQGALKDVPDRMLGYLAACLERPGPSTPVVRELLGRPAIPFFEWAKENAAAFRS